MKQLVFKDKIKLYASAGNGGDGMSTFRREKFVPFGGPSGGDGAAGGDVLLQGNVQLNSLLDLYYRPHQKAQHGGKGGPGGRTGRRGEDRVIEVPCGTVVFNDEGERIGEIVEDGERLQVAKGGKGGFGNIHFKTSTNRAPTDFTEGTPGEARVLWLELKIISDIGLVGYPNAGKSTLLSKLSQAHPKVAAYPFTTLNPIIGTMYCPDYKTLLVADIPGLIEGAHAGIGLGHDFLRHIERTRFLVFVIDMGGTDGRNPSDDFLNLRKELRLFKAELDDRLYLVVANKMDVPGSSELLAEFLERTGEHPTELCAEINEGVESVAAALNVAFYGPDGIHADV
ncbi:MAG: GTP-binding protein [Kiritimatiellia bacterium]|jgi:GTPase